MIGWFIQYQQISVACGEPSQRHTVSLAAAQLTNRLKHHITLDAEAGQQIATLLLVELLSRWTNDLNRRLRKIHAFEQLVEISDMHSGSERGRTRVHGFLVEQARS